MFEAIGRGEIKALWVMGDQSGGVAAARCRDARRRSKASSSSSYRTTCCRTTRSMRARRCCCRPPPGARRTARSPIPSAASRASARSCRCRARRSPTGGSSRKWRSAWALRTPSRTARPRTFSASTPRCRASRTAAPAPSISAALASISDARYDALDPVQWPARCDRRIASSVFSRRRLLHRRPQGAVHRAGAAGAGCRSCHPSIPAASQHRPRARPVAHHDPHRPEPDARATLPGAVRGGAPARCRRARLEARRLRARAHARMAPAS